MRPGETLDGRYRVDAVISAAPEITRWLATHLETGETVEVVAPIASEGGVVFERLHRALMAAPAEPALVRPRELLRLPDGRPAIVRAATPQLAVEVAIDRLPPDRIAAVAARLLPAVLAAGGATFGALTPHDVGVDPEGRVVLAPLGRPRVRLFPDDTRRASPESFQGATPDAAAGLYGLGVLVYEWLTGRVPAGAHPPPPSTLRHGVPAALDEAVVTLLARDPSRRASALPLLLSVAGPTPDLRALPPPAPRQRLHAEPGAVKVTVDGPAPLSERVAVVLPADQLAIADPAARSAIAGETNLPVSAIEQLVKDGVPVVLSTHPSRARANAEATRIGQQTRLDPRVVGGGDGCLFGVIALGVIAVPLVLLATGVATLLTGGLPFAGAIALALALVGVVGIGLVTARRSRARADVAVGRDAVRKARVRLGHDAAMSEAMADIARLRRSLAARELPAAAATDLRTGLRLMDDHLESVADLARRCDEALAWVDLPALRTRLAALANTRDHVERDRVARTVADLEEIRRKRDEVDEAVARVRSAAAEVAGALASWGDGIDDDQDLDALLRAARALGPAATDDEPLPREGTTTEDAAKAPKRRRETES
jgi:hypothetical protein